MAVKMMSMMKGGAFEMLETVMMGRARMVGGAFAMAAGTVVPATIAVAAAPSVFVVIYATAVRSVCAHVFPQFGASCNY